MLQDAQSPRPDSDGETSADAEPQTKSTIPLVLPSQDSQRPRPTEPLLTLRRPEDVPQPRSALIAMPGLVLLAIVAAFFSWVTAEPFWLATGHTVNGTVTVNRCLDNYCEGDFRPHSGADTLPDVRITGEPEFKHAGETASAQASSDHARTVYIGDTAGAWWRVGMGLAAIVACGVGIAAVTGAWRWRGAARWATVAASIGGPLLLLLSTLALTW